VKLRALILFVALAAFCCQGCSSEDESITVVGPAVVSFGYDGVGPDGVRLNGPMVSISAPRNEYWLSFSEPQSIRTGEYYRVTGKVVVDSTDDWVSRWLIVESIERVEPTLTLPG
jgi:hypothetical protein